MLTKLAHDYEVINKMAAEEEEEKNINTFRDAGYGAKLGGGIGAVGGAIGGGILGQASRRNALGGAALGSGVGALAGGMGGGLTGGSYGLVKDVFDIQRPEDKSNLNHDARTFAAMGAGMGAIGGLALPGNRVANSLASAVQGGIGGGLFGVGTGYLKDRDERQEG